MVLPGSRPGSRRGKSRSKILGTQRVQLLGSWVLRQDNTNNTEKWGAAIAVKQELKQGQRHGETRGHAAIVSARIEGVVIASVYTPPTGMHKKLLAEIVSENLATQWHGHAWMLVGDWNDDQIETKDTNVTELLLREKTQIRVVTTGAPTRWESQRCID